MGANTFDAGLGFSIPLVSQAVGNGNRLFLGAEDVVDFAAAGPTSSFWSGSTLPVRP